MSSDFYDIFATKHTPLQERLLLSMNANIVRHLVSLRRGTGEMRVLEIGPGKGYFSQAVRAHGSVYYCALDRNERLLRESGARESYLSEATAMPAFENAFEAIVASYVIEHLDNGRGLYDFAVRCRESLLPGGVLMLFAPNALRARMEFWNIDYTHVFPTTPRNVTMALQDAGFHDIRISDVHGLLTHRWFTNPFLNGALGALVSAYDYRFWNALAKPLYRTPLSDLSNVFYRMYCLIKEENMMIVARR